MPRDLFDLEYGNENPKLKYQMHLATLIYTRNTGTYLQMHLLINRKYLNRPRIYLGNILNNETRDLP